MWTSDANEDEGGFNVTMTQSPASGAVTESKQNTVIPMTIRELLNSNEENKNMHVVVVGVIKQVKCNIFHLSVYIYIYINGEMILIYRFV